VSGRNDYVIDQKVRGTFYFAFLLLLTSSCTRSPEFRRDQEFRSDSAAYGAHHGGAGRAEGMLQPKKRVYVLNFWNDTPVKENDLGFFIADELRRDLFLSQKLIVPSDIKTEFTTEDFIQNEKVKVAQLIREGRKMGVSVLVIGRIPKIVFRQKGEDVGLFRQKESLAAVDLEIKVFDVAAGREILASSKSGETTASVTVGIEKDEVGSPAYRTELTKLAARNATALLVADVVKAVDKMTWEGRIAKVSGTKIFVNAGRASGLIQGDILKVLTPGEDVYDPASGAFLGRSQGQLKGTLEVTDFLGTDGAVTEVHTGANFQESDVVQLY
jgi:hypothetical protein